MTSATRADDNHELTLSFVVVMVLAGVYFAYEWASTPAGGHPFGHWLGIIGTLLMVITEVAYSARKRLHWIKIGQVRHWLSWHIFTGIVGPSLVLMHTAFEFNGLAGLTMLLTVLVVLSGFLGRYLYTAVPRTLAGVEVDRRELEAQAARQQAELTAWAAQRSAQMQALVAREGVLPSAPVETGPWAFLLWRIEDWRERARVHVALRGLDRAEQARVAEIERLLGRQRQLVRQIQSLQMARRAMGLWHTAHVPLGLTLFMSIAIHVAAALFYKGL